MNWIDKMLLADIVEIISVKYDVPLEIEKVGLMSGLVLTASLGSAELIIDLEDRSMENVGEVSLTLNSIEFEIGQLFYKLDKDLLTMENGNESIR